MMSLSRVLLYVAAIHVFAFAISSSRNKCNRRCGMASITQNITYDSDHLTISPLDSSCHFHTFPPDDARSCLKGGWLIFFGGTYTYGLARRIASFFASSGSNIDFEPRPERNFDYVWKQITDQSGTKVEIHVHYFNHMKVDSVPTTNHVSDIVTFLDQTLNTSTNSAFFRITMIEDRSLFLASTILRDVAQELQVHRLFSPSRA